MNYLLIPTLLLALVLFGIGVRLARKTGGGLKYNLLVIAGVLMALPGMRSAEFSASIRAGWIQVREIMAGRVRRKTQA